MPSIDDAARIVAGLPETLEIERHGSRTWTVRGKGFAWERPFSTADLKRFGTESPPEGPILAVRVADLDDKEIVLASHRAFFTIPHFAGYAAVLIELRAVRTRELEDALADAWLSCAPPSLGASFLETRRSASPTRRRRGPAVTPPD